MITKLSIQHYRSIQSLELSLGNVNVFVGPNGAGKSNVVDAIKFVRDALRNGVDQAITERHGLNSIRQWAPTRPYNITIAVEIRGPRYPQNDFGSFSFTLGSKGDEYLILREEGSWTEVRTVRNIRRSSEDDTTPRRRRRHASYSRDKQGVVTLKVSSAGQLPGFVRSSPDQFEIDNIDDFFLNSRLAPELASLRSHLINFENYVMFPNTLREPQKLSNEVHLSSHGDNLTSILRRMRNKKRSSAVSEIIESMKAVVPNLDNINVQSVGGYLTPQFRLIHAEDESRTYNFNVTQMSDGTLRMLGLLVALYQDPRPEVIALEEPELTVHPGMLPLITDSIAEISEGTQVLVTTHSPELIDRFDPTQIIAVELEKGITTVRPLNATQVEAVRRRLFSLGELMSVEGLHG